MSYYEELAIREQALKLACQRTEFQDMGEKDIVEVAKVFEAYLKGGDKDKKDPA